MKKTTFGICLAAIILIPFGLFAREPLTFKERVDAQEAIERVYYNHRVWPKENTRPKPAFDKMIDRETIEAKVSDYLKKSEALGQMWQRPIEGRQLQAEMERMAKQTKDPATLKELFAALGNDPYLIAECLARPALADRLIRNWYAFDPRFHADVRSEAEKGSSACCTVDGMRSLSGVYGETLYLRSMDESGADPGAEASEKTINLDEEQWESLLARLGGDASERPGEIVPGRMFGLREEEDCFLLEGIKEYSDGKLLLAHVVWRKMPFREWFSNDLSLNSDHSLESNTALSEGDMNFTNPSVQEDTCSDDTWLAGAVPSERYGHTAVWTGTEMIVWGGSGTVSTIYFKSGGRYNPITDSWTAMSMGGNCPSARSYHTAVWTGIEMVIWGGYYYDGTGHVLNTGGRYNPTSDSWSAVSLLGAPAARYSHTAVWTGSQMIIWGSINSNTGGRYSPSTDTWASMSTTGAPSNRIEHTAVWTDTEMIVWGGLYSACLNSGGRYNPGTDTWTTVDTTGAPAARQRHTAVWTGSEMIVWGGNSGGTSYLGSGGRYNPTSNSWTATSTGTDCPSPRWDQTAVWTGTVMVVWGGSYYDGTVHLLNSGGRYNPASDSWTAVSLSGAPASRSSHTAVWTESEMIVWGGNSHFENNNGGRYNPASDSWVPTVSNGAPSSRHSYSTVWTGGEMIIWGGGPNNTYLETGGKYDPALDNWSATETSGAPSARSGHTAVWTGSEMVVWGGYYYDGTGHRLNSGGRYTPSSDSWTAVASSGAPSGRSGHTAVWTGTEMVVWGGGQGPFNTGGRYNPSLNTWTPTSTAGAPSPRWSHSAIWTGTEMIIWGGENQVGVELETGGRYLPSSDSWIPMSALDAPSARSLHTAVWTGSRMIIWGGTGYLNTGGIYSPSSDIWIPTATTGAPTGRCSHSALWTEGEMIVWGGSSNGFVSGGGGTTHARTPGD